MAIVLPLVSLTSQWFEISWRSNLAIEVSIIREKNGDRLQRATILRVLVTIKIVLVTSGDILNADHPSVMLPNSFGRITHPVSHLRDTNPFLQASIALRAGVFTNTERLHPPLCGHQNYT
ncbi:MAG: hypothetical protein F6K36_29555 [Symploca sp. SIO3C6]|nr:hypothetical protein [Symploca sp. SIO3C6]